ncbi:MAG: hypothetical protein K9J81_03530 [Desulfohalobiaceae bacterium]|nr:hypothetical protein [Desulfohalobiaceae bacterium]
MRKPFKAKWWLVLMAFMLTGCQSSEPPESLEKVVLQLKWHHQVQFAGYYLAREHGL